MGETNNIKSIQYPSYSIQLAEFTGIILGDGGLTRYQLTVTLHYPHEDEYIKFVSSLIEELFGVTPAFYYRKKFSAVNVVISRKKIILFCNEKLGIEIGDKMRQEIDIPDWIKRDKKFSMACMRGLFDTDGSVVLHKYSVNGKEYCYKKLEFCSMSPALRNSAYNILSDLKLKPRMARQKSVWIDSKDNVNRYFKSINSHNSKHLKRYGK